MYTAISLPPRKIVDLRDCEYDEPEDARFLVVLVYSGK
jgi:hypothetical protein